VYAREMLRTFRQQAASVAAGRGVRAAGWELLQALGDTVRNAWQERVTGRDPVHRHGVRATDRLRILRRTLVGMWWFTDLRYALRLLSKTPAFTAMSVMVLSGGLGVSIFTFSFLYAVLFKPLPLPDGEEIVKVFARGASPMQLVDAADYAVVRGAQTLTAMGAYVALDAHLRVGEGARTLYATSSHWNVFDVARVPPLLGRTLRSDDQRVGAEPVAVLAHDTWQAMFGGDSAAVGRVVTVNGVGTRIIGVMPDGFTFPLATELWMPLPEDIYATVPGRRHLNVYARLERGATIEQANAEIDGLLQALWLSESRQDLPGAHERPVTGGMVTTFQRAQIGPEGFLLFIILNVLAGFILLLACINATNLLLARANERRSDMAVRIALGAPRFRLVVQALWETVLVSAIGAAVAVVIAAAALWTVDAWAQANIGGNLAFWWRWGPDGSTAISAAGFALLAIAVVGGVVVYRTARGDFHAVMRDSAAGSGNRQAGRLARALVILQVVMVSVVMFCGAVSGITAYEVLQLDLFRERDKVVLAILSPDGDRYDEPEERQRLFEALHEALEARSTFDGVMLRTELASGTEDGGRFVVEGPAYSRSEDHPRAFASAVSGTFEPLGSQLRAGRLLDARDVDGATPTALVSESLAQAQWPDGPAIGKRLRLVGLGPEEEWRTVVGVVGDVLEGNPLTVARSSMSVYVPLRQTDASSVAVMIRHRGNEREAQTALRQVMSDHDPLLVPDRIVSYAELFSFFTMMTSATVKMFVGCFVFALVLAVTGIYGLTARSVSQRTREIGVRRALGASDLGIVRLLMREGGWQLGIGLLTTAPVMVAASAALTQVLALELAVFVVSGAGVAVVVAASVLAATYFPSRRAVALEPSRALWQE
jgi:predicted permease